MGGAESLELRQTRRDQHTISITQFPSLFPFEILPIFTLFHLPIPQLPSPFQSEITQIFPVGITPKQNEREGRGGERGGGEGGGEEREKLAPRAANLRILWVTEFINEK